MYLRTILLSLSCHVSFWTQLAGAQGFRVNTTSGIITGHASQDASEVVEYLGIPYAKPPTGDLRFASPEPYDGAGTEFEAKEFSLSCPFIPGPSLQPDPIPGFNVTPQARSILSQGLQTSTDPSSEDCLTINVWVPSKNASTSDTKAAMVYFYGGAFTTGDASLYHGAYLAAEQDVIFISLNYRTTIFGFPGSPKSSLNAGILDQRLALQWVRDNIASFNGDPSRITIFGQSAGAISVDYHTFAWPDDPIAHAFIEQSGTSMFSPPLTPDGAALNWYNITAKLGCGNAQRPVDEVLECMRGLDVQDIISAVAVLPATSAPGGSYIGAFYPTADNRTIFADYPGLLRAGRFSKRPLLLGNNAAEHALQQVIVALALGQANVPGIPSEAYYEAFDRVMFACPAAQRAYWSAENGVSTFRYVYYGDWEDLWLTVPSAGAWHGAEGNLVFGYYADDLEQPTEEQLKAGKEIRDAWAGFAKDPTVLQDWAKYVPEEKTLRRLAWNNKAGENYIDPRELDFACSFYDAIFGNQGATRVLDEAGESVYEALANLTKGGVERSLRVYSF